MFFGVFYRQSYGTFRQIKLCEYCDCPLLHILLYHSVRFLSICDNAWYLFEHLLKEAWHFVEYWVLMLWIIFVEDIAMVSIWLYTTAKEICKDIISFVMYSLLTIKPTDEEWKLRGGIQFGEVIFFLFMYTSVIHVGLQLSEVTRTQDMQMAHTCHAKYECLCVRIVSCKWLVNPHVVWITKQKRLWWYVHDPYLGRSWPRRLLH